MVELCTASDLRSYGLPRGGLANRGRLVSSVSTSSNSFALDDHGFDTDDTFVLRAESGGSLPAPLVEATTYYAIRVDDFSFQASATEGGAAIDLTTAGSRTLVIAPLPIAKSIQWASDIIIDQLPAHVAPDAPPYATILVATAAELAVSKLLTHTGQGSTAGLTKMVDDALKRVERWAKSIPLRGPNAPASANLALTKPTTGGSGWGCGFP